MTSREFCYWLQGFFEVHDAGLKPDEVRTNDGLIGEKVRCIKQHLALVFKHEIDPSYGDAKHQEELQKIHDNVDGLSKTVAGLVSKDTRIRC